MLAPVSFTCALLVAAGQAVAQDVPPEGCFMTMIDFMAEIAPGAPDSPIVVADLKAVPDSGPRPMTIVAAWRGASAFDVLECGGLAGLDAVCMPTGCKGGSVIILKWDATTITLGTSDLKLGRGDCETARNLAPEVGKTVLYEMHKVDNSMCRR